MPGTPQVVATEWLFEAGELVPGLDGVVAATTFVPPPGTATRPIAFCCLAGGGMSRTYWDLFVPQDDTYSFARWSASQGFPVITVDHLGAGGSTLPEGVRAPLLRDLIAADDAVFRLLSEGLRRSGLGGIPIPDLATVGVGHSLGAVLTVRQQSVYRTHRAVALLGFSTRGRTEQLNRERLAEVDHRANARRTAKLASLMFNSPYALIDDPGGLEESVRHAITAAATEPLTAGGLLGMRPRNVANELTQLTVPVLILNGADDRLIRGRPEDARRCPTGSESRVIPGSGHNHNVAEARHRIWAHVVEWAHTMVL